MVLSIMVRHISSRDSEPREVAQGAEATAVAGGAVAVAAPVACNLYTYLLRKHERMPGRCEMQLRHSFNKHSHDRIRGVQQQQPSESASFFNSTSGEGHEVQSYCLGQEGPVTSQLSCVFRRLRHSAVVSVFLLWCVATHTPLWPTALSIIWS